MERREGRKMDFTIYPAIDILDGNCVRLLQGDFEKKTEYSDSPFQLAKYLCQQGADWLHIGDLDGVIEGKPVNVEFVIKCAENLKVNLQVGGGIRTEAEIVRYLEAGINRVILGSLAITNPEFVVEMIKKYGEAIAISIDVKEQYVTTKGWTKKSALKPIEVGKAFADAGAETFILTSIEANGTLAGPNFTELEEFASAVQRNTISAGGISTLADIDNLKSLTKKGVSGAILGKALYEERFSLSEALKK
jgi:phosphoribosylformimino-5-aminoimidazole carboxamide ribotide isomerase